MTGRVQRKAMKLFNWAKIIAVSESNKKDQIQELFAAHNIKYKMKVKEILQNFPINMFSCNIT